MKARLIFLCVVTFLLNVSAFSDEIPSVSELLDKYSENQKKISSFISKGICTEERKSAFGKPVTRIETSSEFRTDGVQIAYRAEWNSEEAQYNDLCWSWLWDGKTFIETQREPKGQQAAVILRNHNRHIETRLTEYAGGPLHGVLGNDITSITIIFNQADAVSVDGKFHMINDSKCYAVKAATKYGQYTIWIDPQHGYNIAQAKAVKRKGDIYWEKPLAPNRYQSISFLLTNVHFEKIDELWIPMEAEYEYKFVNREGKVGKNKQHYKRIDFMLNPDHEALASFVPDNIIDGSPVYIEGKENTQCTWQDGKVLDSEGKVVVNTILDKK